MDNPPAVEAITDPLPGSSNFEGTWQALMDEGFPDDNRLLGRARFARSRLSQRPLCCRIILRVSSDHERQRKHATHPDRNLGTFRCGIEAVGPFSQENQYREHDDGDEGFCSLDT